MTKIMPKDQVEEKLRWIKPVLEKRLTIDQIALVAPFSRRTICTWLNNYKKYGDKGLINKSTRPHNSPNKTPSWIEEKIIDLNLDFNLGGLKITWELKKQGIYLHERTANRILSRNGLCKRNRPINQQKYHHKQIVVPGEIIEVDVKYGIHFGFNRWWYQYTAIDVASRWRYLQGYPNMENNYTWSFIENLLGRTNPMFTIKAIKTDNGAVFTNRLNGLTACHQYHEHILDKICAQHRIKHYLISPGCPTQNAHVERSHRSDQEYFYDYIKRPCSIEEYNYQLALWNSYYNDLPHCGLKGKSPNQYLREWK